MEDDFGPVISMLMIIVIAQVPPQPAFSYGLYAFHMNAAMMVWFVYFPAAGNKMTVEVEE